jgi:hypothetical protein
VAFRELLAIVVVFGLGYGIVLGAFGIRPLQMFYSATKVPLLLGATTLICLPSFYALHAILGLRDQFGAALRAVLASQATLSVCLASLAPLTALVYVSTDRYPVAILQNGVAFALATGGAQRTLARHYRPLIAVDRRHRATRAAWLLLYVFVAIQMAWVLRPFVGAPTEPTRFFREEAWSNAYVRVFETVLRAFR